MRFIHLADVHLGAVPDRGCPWSSRREEEIWETFRRVIAGIRENPVDLLFIAGDVTDISYKQIIIAMGEGAKAALAAFEDRMRGEVG